MRRPDRLIAPHVVNVQTATGGMRNWILNLHAALAVSASTPRTWPSPTPTGGCTPGGRKPNLAVQDLPDDYLDRGRADKFVEP
ncbi:hypothetical protein RKD32_000036 [Streptomyces sp. SAI-195]|uniref:hypothetical protein n=1 Tax=unclassified Streptomyces TaxID=2593676 RepID=UPI003435648C